MKIRLHCFVILFGLILLSQKIFAQVTVTGGTFCGSSAVTLTASGGSPAGGTYNWYSTLIGGVSLATGSSYSPTPATTTTYYVDYTQGGVTTTPRSAGTAVIIAPPVLSTAPTTGGLYLSYPFTGNANDASGSGNNGTIQGAATLTLDRYGNANSAYNFNGSTQYVSTATLVASPGPQNFSISVWFKTSTAGGKLVGYGSSQTGGSGSYDRHIYMNNSGQIYYGIYPGGVKTINTAATYADGNWHHVVATTSTTNGSHLYVDGALQAVDATMTICQAYSGYWRVGYDNLGGWTSAPTNLYFTGSLDDIAVYNTEITPAQVYTLYGAGSSPICSGTALSLQANTVAGATYSWSGPGGYSSTVQNPTVTTTAAAANAGTYTCTVTGSNGCQSVINVTAVVNSLPVSTFTATSPIFVTGSSTITYTGTFAATSTYTWNFGGGTVLSGSGVGPYTVQWPSAGSKTVTLTVTNSNGCSSTSTQTVVVTNYTQPTVTGGTFCGSSGVTLTASGEIAGGTYNWYAAATGGVSLATGTSYSPTPATTTTYYVDYTLNGTTTSPRVAGTATISSSPVLSTAPTTGGLYLSYPFTGNANDASGSGNNGTIQGAAALTLDRYGNANSAYNFNGSTQYVSTATLVASPGPQNFSISVWFKTSTAGGKLVGYGSAQTGASGQFDRHIYMNNSGQIYYGIYPGAVKTINTAAAYADGNWHHVVATTSTTNGSHLYVDGALQAVDVTMTTCQAYSGYWRVGYDNLNIWTSAPTNYFFTGSLDDIAVYNNEITPAQVYTLYGAGSPPACLGYSLSLQANTVAGATYSWSGPNSFSSTVQNPTVTTTAAAANAGTYTCTVTGSNGCISTINVTAVVNPAILPAATFTATSPIFLTGSSTITYTGTYAATSTYTWNFGSGTVLSGSGVGPYTVQWPSVGSQTVTLTVTNSSGCPASSTQTVVVINNVQPTVTGGTFCGSGAAVLTASGETGGGTYNWYAAATGGVSLATGASYSPAPITTTTYYVDYTLNGTTTSPRVAGTATISSPPVLSTAPTSPTSGLYLSYPFTGNANDASGNSNDGTVQGAASLTTDRYGNANNAYNFNGSTQYVSTTTLVASPGPQNFSISVWFKTSTAGGKLVGYGSSQTGGSGSYDRHIYMNNSGQIYYGIYPGGIKTINTTATYADGNWHHVVATTSTTNGSHLYVDGALQAVDANMTTCQAYSGYWHIGYDNLGGWTSAPTDLYFTGSLDDVAVHNTEITPAQVYILYGAGSSTFCAGNSFSLSANTVAGATYSWTGPGSFTSALQNPTVSSAIAGTYVLTVTGAGGCTSTINVTAPSNAITYTWSGAAGTTNPATAGNWDHLPPFNSTSNLVIPNGMPKYPVLTANETIYGLTVASGASLSLNGYTLNVGCNIINNATTSATSGIIYGNNTASAINWNGTFAAQSYTGTNNTNTASLGNMTVNNSAGGTITINGGPIDIYNLLTLTQGNLVIGASPALLTLKSSSTLTASVTAIPVTSSITGNVSAERYISGGSAAYRGYRLLSSPVYTGSSGSNYYYDLSYLSSFAPTTGSNGTSGGFTKTGNPTMYLFRDNIATVLSFYSGNYRAIGKINNSPLYAIGIDYDGTFNLNIGTGFVFYYRGNLTNLSNKYFSTTVAEPNIFVSTGTLNQQAVTVINWFTGLNTLQYSTVAGNASAKGFNLVGNPYASSIDWNTYSTTNAAAGIYGPNVGSTIWVDNTIDKAYGAYNAGIGTNGATNIIVSGQGFFVQANNTGAQLIFNEAAKTNAQLSGPTLATGSTLLLSKAPVANTVLQYLRLELEKDSLNKVDMVVRFSNSAKNSFVVNEDSQYIPGTGKVNLCSKSTDNVDLAINNIPFPKQSQTIKLNVNVTADGTYKLNKTEIKAIPNLYEMWLMDAYKKDSLDIKHNSTYIFQIAKSDTNSYGSNRFSLVIRQNPQLGLHLLDFTATKASDGVQVVWKTENEENYTYFTVERSIDNGANFSVLGGFVSSAMGTYSLLDNNPLQANTGVATNLYRLKIEDLNGAISYSNVVTLTCSNSDNNNINVYPNPATSTINLIILKNNNFKQNNTELAYNIKIINSYGITIKTAASSQDSWQSDIGDLMPGTYFIQVINNNDKNIVGISKFIKL
jgi:hypothetical protein